jgi:hypothetical protein
MIRVTVELWPWGDETRKRVIAVANIYNNLSAVERPVRGNYGYSLWGKKKLLQAGEVQNFPRQRLNVWHLLQRVLEDAFGEIDV